MIYLHNVTNNYPEPTIQFYGLNGALIDEIEVWKITDASLARAWLDNSRYFVRGDANDDFNLDTRDISLFITQITNDSYTSASILLDANNDSDINIMDLVDLKKKVQVEE